MRIGKFKWIVYGVVALCLAWRIMVVNISQHLASENSAAATLWNRDTPDALLVQAANAAGANPEQGLSLALSAALHNPADGRAFLVLALLWEQKGKQVLAEKAARMSNFLAPHRSEIQFQLGNFWARHDSLANALPHWSAAIEMRPELGSSLYPVMLSFADTPQLRRAFAKMLNDPPAWWTDFFLYALNNAAHQETLKAIYLVSANSKHGTGHAERKAYLDHLFGSSMWTDAYFVWLNGLDARQLSVLGNIYDGGFEREMSDEGYGWRPSTGGGFTVATEPTYGDGGERALHVAFQGHPSQYRLIRQYLILDSGQYHFQGRVRLDSLSAGKGLRWVVTCAKDNGSMVLVTSEHFIGADHWKEFVTDLNVPKVQCETQMLSLEIDPGTEDQSDYGGAVWFDDLVIERLDQ